MKKLFVLMIIALFVFSCQEIETGIGSSVNTEITSEYLWNETNLTTYMGDMEVVRLKGKPGVEIFDIGEGDLTVYEPCFILYIATGEESAGTVSSAIVKFDGVEILNTSDFSGNAYKEYKFEICNLNEASILEVEIRGKPGSYLDIWINGKPFGGDPFAGNEGTFTDSRDSHVYSWVRIGGQIWMAENLAYLPSVSPRSDYSSSESKYYVYDYNGSSVDDAKETDNYEKYGVLYNFPAASSGCPAGWHLPTRAEWTELLAFLESNGYGYGGNGDDIAKALAATTDWYISDIEGTPGNDINSNNSSGFSALPGGNLSGGDSETSFNGFGSITTSGYWWYSEYDYINYADIGELSFGETTFLSFDVFKNSGISVRCVRDE